MLMCIVRLDLIEWACYSLSNSIGVPIIQCICVIFSLIHHMGLLHHQIPVMGCFWVYLSRGFFKDLGLYFLSRSIGSISKNVFDAEKSCLPVDGFLAAWITGLNPYTSWNNHKTDKIWANKITMDQIKTFFL